MQINHRFVNQAHTGQQIGILVADRVRAGDSLLLLED
jgi:hypothetical protein